jgi:hypothetical protein
LLLIGLLASCALPGDAAPVVKIGLIAPFEGLGRPLGYAVLPAVKAAIAETNASNSLHGYRVALVALNDDLDPATAARQAGALAQDRDILAVLGPFDSPAARQALPVLAAAAVPLLAAAPIETTTRPPAGASCTGIFSLCPSPEKIDAALRVVIGLSPWTSDAVFAADALTRGYAAGQPLHLVGGPDLLRPWLPKRAGIAAEGTEAFGCAITAEARERPESGGGDASLDHAAVLAGAGTRTLLAALAADIGAHGAPSRAGVAAALAARPIESGLVRYRVQDGAWQRLPAAP